MAHQIKTTTSVAPDKGRVTWDSEGTEGGRYHSRKPTVPGDWSGVTIGRGYDMAAKLPAKIIRDLTSAGVPRATAEKLSGAAGLTGDDARDFLKEHKLGEVEITLAAQKALFEITYRDEAREARRVAGTVAVVERYGACDWDTLDPAIEQMLVDLKFRGDYTGRARALIQDAVVNNDLEAFAKPLLDKANWPNVPKDRFDRRARFLKDALAAKKARDKLVKPAPLAHLHR